MKDPRLLDDGAGCAAADSGVAGIMVDGEVVGGGGGESSSSVIGDGSAIGDDGARCSATHSILAFIVVDGAVFATGSGIGDDIVNSGGAGCVESGGRGCAGGTIAADDDGARCSAADRIVAGVTVDDDSASGGVGGFGGGVFIHVAT